MTNMILGRAARGREQESNHDVGQGIGAELEQDYVYELDFMVSQLEVKELSCTYLDR